MKCKYIKPAVKLIKCYPTVLLSGSPTQSTMDNKPIDNNSNPNPGSRRFDDGDRFGDSDWWEE